MKDGYNKIMFGLSGGEILTLFVIALVLMGPKRLPTAAKQAAVFLKKARNMATNATNELRSTLGPGFEDLEITDLHPKNLVKKHLGSALDEHVDSIKQPLSEINSTLSAPLLNNSNIPNNTNSSNQLNNATNVARIDPDLI